MTRCENCNHEFTNIMLRRNCPRCGQSLKKTSVDDSTSSNRTDDAFDSTGFALGMATGVPLSPTHGISTGSILGAALHSDPSPSPSSTPSCDTSSSSSSSSSDSSSSGSDSSSSCGGGGGGE